MMNLKHNIIFYKNMMNISYRTLCKEADVSRASIQNIMKLKDFSNVSLGTVMKLASYFKVTIDDLVYKDLSIENRLDYEEKER